MIKVICDECKKDIDVMPRMEITIYFAENDEPKGKTFVFCSVDCAKKFTSEIKEETKNAK